MSGYRYQLRSSRRAHREQCAVDGGKYHPGRRYRSLGGKRFVCERCREWDPDDALEAMIRRRER